MNAAIPSQVATVNPYRDIYEQFAEDASFLWLLRSIAVNQPHYTPEDLTGLEQRITAQLDGLMTAPEEAWEICHAATERQEPGEAFTAAVLAFRSLDVTKIQRAVEAGFAGEIPFKGLVSALGWLPGRLCHSWIKRFLTSKNFDHKYLAIAACSVRREDPREYLTSIFQRPDCVAHRNLYARSVRLVGELKRSDLMPALRIAMRADDPGLVFWANWSAILLGDGSAVQNLRPFVLQSESAYQAKAIQLAFRALPVREGREWVSRLAADPEQIRNVVKATAALGDPHAVDWLISRMRDPALSRLAGEAFTMITGIDLEEQGLALDGLPDLDGQFPNEDPEDGNVALDEDENLPFPDVAKIAAVWEKYRHRFVAGQRHFLGKAPESDFLRSCLAEKGQRLRQAAAMELALLEHDQYLINTSARISEQYD